MRGRLILLTFLLLTGVALTGCGKRVGPLPPAITENITLFYGDEGNEKMVTEQRQISFNPEDDKYKLALIELIRGPTIKITWPTSTKNNSLRHDPAGHLLDCRFQRRIQPV